MFQRLYLPGVGECKPKTTTTNHGGFSVLLKQYVRGRGRCGLPSGEGRSVWASAEVRNE